MLFEEELELNLMMDDTL